MRLIVEAFFSGVSAGRSVPRPGRMSRAMRRFDTMALDADAEPLTRDDIDGIIAHGDPVDRMFLLRRHDLTARQWLRLLSDGNILVRDDARDTLRDRAASRLLVLVGFHSRPRMPFIERYDLAGQWDLTRGQRRMLVRDPDKRVRERFIERTDLTRREQIKLVLTTPMPYWSVVMRDGY